MPALRPISAVEDKDPRRAIWADFPNLSSPTPRKSGRFCPKKLKSAKNPLKNAQNASKSLLRQNLMAIRTLTAARYLGVREIALSKAIGTGPLGIHSLRDSCMAATKTTGKKAPAKKAPAKKAPAAKKPAARATAVKKPAAKAAAKPAAKRAAPAKAPAAKAPVKKVTAVSAKMSKATILNEIAGTTGLARKDVASVMAELETIIERHLKKRAVGEFALPGLLKIKTVKKPAQRAKKGVPNPFKPGETMDVAAKPASVRVRITPLKKLKDMAQ